MRYLQIFIGFYSWFLLSSCVSSKKYRNVLLEINEKNNAINLLKKDTSNLYGSLMFLDNKYFELNEELRNLKLLTEKQSKVIFYNNQSSEFNNSSNEYRQYLNEYNKYLNEFNESIDTYREYINETRKNLLIPTIPIPPPQPTSHYIFEESILKMYKKYGQIDSLISHAFQLNKYNKIYLAVENGGFAIATNIEEIDQYGNKCYLAITFQLQLLIYYKRKIKDVFFSKTGYYRCIIIVVSPNLYQLGGNLKSYEEINAWLNEKTIRLPDYISKSNINQTLQMVALLYEFQQNENTNYKTQIIDEAKSKTKLLNNSLIKTLINGN